MEPSIPCWLHDAKHSQCRAVGLAGDCSRAACRDALRDPQLFARASLGDCGHSVVWPDGTELSAETLWLETLTAIGRPDARAFLEWRLRHGLSLSATAHALGVSRRMIAYYSNGEKPVPRPILLACRGWKADAAA
jgi:hypothetical protein